MITLLFLVLAQPHAQASNELTACVADVLPALRKESKEPPIWLENYAGTACKGGNRGERALQCLHGLTAPHAVLNGDLSDASVACSGGSTAESATECIHSFDAENTLGSYRSIIATTACAGGNTGARALRCVRGLAAMPPVTQIKLSSGYQELDHFPQGPFDRLVAARYEVAALACRGGGEAAKTAACLNSVAEYAREEAEREISATAAASDDPNSALYAQRSRDEYANPSKPLQIAADACSAGNTADQAKSCIGALVPVFSKKTGEANPLHVAASTCSFGQTADAAVDCTSRVLEIVADAQARSGWSSMGGTMNPLIYVERHCTGDMLARVSSINTEAVSTAAPAAPQEAPTTDADVGAPTTSTKSGEPNAGTSSDAPRKRLIK